MKNRSELFSIFESFFNEIKDQFRVSIQTFHCNNTHEYHLNSFFTFMKSHGIVHETSCAYTPQKMGWLSTRIDILLKLPALY